MEGSVTYNQALTSPETHVFIPGIGYVDMQTAPDINPNGLVGNCNPPKKVVNMSWHSLMAPSGDTVTFQWLDRNGVWLRIDINGRRIGFYPSYLSSHGWTYAGLATNRHG